MLLVVIIDIMNFNSTGISNTSNFKKIEYIKNIVVKNSELFGNVKKFTITIKSLPIYDNVIDLVKLIVENISMLESLKIKYYDYIKQSDQNIDQNDCTNSLSNLLHLFDDVKCLKIQCLNRSGRFALLSKIKNRSGKHDNNDNTIIESINKFLYTSKIEKLQLALPFNKIEPFIQTIRSSVHILHVTLNISTSYNSTDYAYLLSNPVPKIDEIKIVNFKNQEITLPTAKNISEIAPKLTSLCFSNKTDKKYITDHILEETMNFIVSNAYVKELHFLTCSLNESDIEYICDKICMTNIQNFSFVEKYGCNYYAVSKIAKMIDKNNKLKEFKLACCDCVDGFLDIVDRLFANVCIEKISIAVNNVDYKDHYSLSKYVLDALSENYTLTDVTICVRDNNGIPFPIDTTSITNRNRLLKMDKRFINTKAVAYD